MRTITIDELTKCLTELNISNEDTTKILNKLNEKKKPVVAEAPKIPIPFCGHIEKSWCCGVRKNHRLYTQCTKAPLPGEDYCKICKKQAENRADGKPKFGTIMERLNKWNDKKLCYQPDWRKGGSSLSYCYDKDEFNERISGTRNKQIGMGRDSRDTFYSKKERTWKTKKEQNKNRSK